MKDLEAIDAGLTVNETIRRFPATFGVFKEFGIDTCCGGAAPLAEAAERKGADPVALLEAVRAAAEAPV
jgi:iron-sulfur cluster repair protein YtfE (RIC family)